MSDPDPAPIIVAGHLTADANVRDSYLRTCEPAVRTARDTDGCLDVAIGADLVDPTRVNVDERWRDRPALEAFRDQGPDDDQMSTLIAINVGEYQAFPGGASPTPRPTDGCETRCMSHLGLVTLVVDDYDSAIRFFVDVLDFELVEDAPSLTNDGVPKRWVVVRPTGAETGLLLARATGDQQSARVGDQTGGRVSFFLHVDDFDAVFEQMTAAGVTFVGQPRDEPYGRIVVFEDIAGNRWDLLG